jgi:hypothetical protein
MFVSYTCWHKEGELIQRYEQLSVASGISILIAFLFLIWTRYAFLGSKIWLLDFDVSTITAGDYTVEMKVPMDKYKDWLETVYKQTYFRRGVSSAKAFSECIRRDVENAVLKEIYRKKNDDVPINLNRNSNKTKI